MKEKLIDAALNQYSLHGYHGATMRKIAAEVDIKPASIYFFYENKEELFIAAFKQLLNNHFKAIEQVLINSKNSPVTEIFTALLHGIVAHHKGDEQSTTAYISLVTSPIPGISKHLNSYMLYINDYLVESLGSVLKKSYPLMSTHEVDRVIKQWVFIGNGVFWGIKLYEGDAFNEQVDLAEKMIQTLFLELEKKYAK
ncbi:TetR/AcrR family transcriptional regulator [Virgibacillus sp. C22-A2]|uniref:TetR/AcrR family transcriptional regulator n=1 Tax=Virgibacillus tibetensis TaxID=3042313 RepID=A0ABU6KE40_9BACI|nr:TetR/AcrR family transcriptional regulator [Virgibacillus sp. C22-A2]